MSLLYAVSLFIMERVICVPKKFAQVGICIIAIFRVRQPSVLLKSGECFPDLLEFPSYLEKIEYVRRILDNQAFVLYKYQNS